MGCEDEKESIQPARQAAPCSRVQPLTIFLPSPAWPARQEARSQQAWWGWGTGTGVSLAELGAVPGVR